MDEQTKAARDALLKAIAESAGNTKVPRSLAQLAYAYASVVTPGSAGAPPPNDEVK